MPIYISMLRGINVAGKNLIKMAALKDMYTKLGFDSVHTYLQSGNVLFESNNADEKELEGSLINQVKKDFGLSVPVIVRSVNYMAEIVEQNPWLNDTTMDKAYMHVTFLGEQPNTDATELLSLKKSDNEQIALGEKAIYLYCPNGYGRTKLTNTFIESKLKVLATTRNWKTTTELLRIAKQ